MRERAVVLAGLVAPGRVCVRGHVQVVSSVFGLTTPTCLRRARGSVSSVEG